MAVKKYLSLVPLAAVMLACLPPSALAAGPVTVTSIDVNGNDTSDPLTGLVEAT